MRSLIAIAAVLLLAPTPAHVPLEAFGAARADIVFTGRVTTGAKRSALQGARVRVVGAGSGTLTDADGRYRLEVPESAIDGGEAELVAEMIGYAAARRRVRVDADSVEVDFALRATAIRLDALTTTASRRRAIGNLSPPPGVRPAFDTEAYARIDENPFLAVRADPRSTFSIDVDRASYSNIRRFVEEGRRPPKDAVRIEEMINYFPYEYPEPGGAHPLSVTTELGPAPWRDGHRLLRIGLRGRAIETAEMPPNNFVLLIDVSGSMRPPNKLPLLKTALRLLVNTLRPQDRVAIVVYAGAAGLVLPSTPGSDRETILDAIARLEAGGATAGGAGLRLAYEVARENYIDGGNNRVILATDGDFNVGESSDAAMVRLIEEKREQGTFLTVLGFGTGNLKDAKMEQIADRGNGNYQYIDGVLEAKKALVDEMGGTLLTIAKDVKVQVEFNPARVRAYRLIGYENRLLRDEDFADDGTDAGEIGAGHTVTALYEVVPVGVESDVAVRAPDSLRYQRIDVRPEVDASAELAFVKVRYKRPDGDTSRLLERAVLGRDARPSDDLRFAAAVAGFGMILRHSEHRGDMSVEDVLTLARRARGRDDAGYRTGFVRLVETVRELGLLEVEPTT